MGGRRGAVGERKWVECYVVGEWNESGTGYTR